MKVKSMKELESRIGPELAGTLFGNKLAQNGGFESLQEAQTWFVVHNKEVRESLFDGVVLYIHAEFGWCLCKVSLNHPNFPCVDWLEPYGVIEVLTEIEAATKNGSEASRIFECLREGFAPDNSFAVVVWNKETNIDFSSLEDAFEFSAIDRPVGVRTTIFCETSKGKWLAVHSLGRDHSSEYIEILEANRWKCFSYEEARKLLN